jgi:hypothetical protein
LLGVPNVFDHDWDIEQKQPGFSWRRMRLGLHLDAEKLGASVTSCRRVSGPSPSTYTGQRGDVGCPRRGDMRSARGGNWGRGDAALFRTGPEGAHQLINCFDRVARYIVVSTMIEPEIVEYPKSGTVGLMAGAPPGKGD